MKDNTVVVLGAPASWVRLSVVFSTRTVTTPKYWIVVGGVGNEYYEVDVNDAFSNSGHIFRGTMAVVLRCLNVWQSVPFPGSFRRFPQTLYLCPPARYKVLSTTP